MVTYVWAEQDREREALAFVLQLLRLAHFFVSLLPSLIALQKILGTRTTPLKLHNHPGRMGLGYWRVSSYKLAHDRNTTAAEGVRPCTSQVFPSNFQ